jgi:transitional endoplasmic reticulum ATPase
MAGSLLVRNSPAEWTGKGKVLLHPDTMVMLGVVENDIVEVLRGFRGKAVARVVPASPEIGIDIILMDRYLRQAAKASLGVRVEIEKAEARPLKRLYVLPYEHSHSHHSENLKNYLKKTLVDNAIPVCEGAVIPVVTPEIRENLSFIVSRIEPSSPGLATDTTEIEILATSDSYHGGSAVTFDDVGGLGTEIQLVREQVELPLRFPQVYEYLGIKAPRGIIFHGPPGVGKTHLALAIANEINAEFFYINGPEIVSTEYGETEAKLRNIFHEASHRRPSVILIDELDVIAPKRGETGSFTSTRIVSQLLTLLDGMRKMDDIIVIGTTNRIDSIEPAMRRAGRFDKEVFIAPPDAAGRLEILRIHSRAMPLSQEVAEGLGEIARRTFGFVGADLVELCREAGLNSLRRADRTGKHQVNLEQVSVDLEDFEVALSKVHPSALRESMVSVPNLKWNDIGGLRSVKKRLQDLVQLPLLHPEAFKSLKIKPPTGILLYGPPGTGKTLLARAIATECQANFISLTGPEIFSQWVGESEEQIRYIFNLARRVVPCIVFFDQIDAIAPRRGKDISSQVTERVINQLLAELDGLEPLSGTIVIGATSRIDLIEPALLRPGRLGIHLSIPLPDEEERREILSILLNGVPLDASIGLDQLTRKLAAITGNFSGADLQMVCEEAKVAAAQSKNFQGQIRLEWQHLDDARKNVAQTKNYSS